jgi:hypothetical protein
VKDTYSRDKCFKFCPVATSDGSDSDFSHHSFPLFKFSFGEGADKNLWGNF